MCLIEHVDDEIAKLKRSGLEVIAVIGQQTKGNGCVNRTAKTDIVT
jgi:hypothetical protein